MMLIRKRVILTNYVFIISNFQTPFGIAVDDIDYDPVFFEEKLAIVDKNYLGCYLPEFFEKRLPRNLEPITVN